MTVDRRQFLMTVGAAGGASLAGCFSRSDDENGSRRRERKRLTFRARPAEERIERTVDEEFEEFLVTGVNLGMAKPGYFPGEAGITREEYDRWLGWIADLGANVIRNYTIHPPAFYRALQRHNDEADSPLYLAQGTWLGEESLLEFGDATRLTDEFHEELRRTVDVVHGEARLDPRPGHASGEFDADVSDFLLGYIAGIEWPPAVVIGTNQREGTDLGGGEYVSAASDASTFEAWLADSLDSVATHAAETYGTQRPLSFTNWVTTDPLDHPYEPFEMEDAVSVDPDSLVATDRLDAGLFASYHVYPYYPDFLNHTPEYVDYVDHRGEANSYAGYLADLVATTRDPLVVAEFGVPSSRGIAHRHVQGRDQGRHSERKQGEHVAAMFEDIVEAQTAGGIVFTWQDEWFKRTWNLMHFSEPNRRPFWSNVQTPEQRFGLLSFDPETAVSLDGTADDWAEATWFEPAADPNLLADGADDSRTLSNCAVTHDEAFLSIRLEFESLADPVPWDDLGVILAIGHTGRGNTTLPFETAASVDPTDFVVRLGGPDDSRLLVDPYYDAFAREYGAEAGLDMTTYREQDSGRFVPSRMTINRGYTVPPTGERVPFEYVETGELRYGNGNPEARAFDSLADVHAAPAKNAIELRLPWLLLNVADPSTRLALGDLWEGGPDSYAEIDGISIGVATYVPDGSGDARAIDGDTNLTHGVPGIADGRLDTATYTWDTWQQPRYVERLKQSYDIVGDTFATYTRD